MNQVLVTRELVKAIQDGRMKEAARRRAVSRQLLRASLTQREALRIALGPGVQFAGVTDRVLEAATGRKLTTSTH